MTPTGRHLGAPDRDWFTSSASSTPHPALTPGRFHGCIGLHDRMRPICSTLGVSCGWSASDNRTFK